MQHLILKSGRERSVMNRHPWVFSGAVKQLPKAENGEIIEVKTNQGELLGYGMYSPESQITVRMFEFGPHTLDINEAYWHRKLDQAFELRKAWINRKHTTCYRLLHAEGDFFPGIIIDIYEPVAVVQLLTKGTELIAASIYSWLNLNGFKHIYLKTKQNTQLLEQVTEGNRWVAEAYPMPVEVLENGFRFLVDVETGQKTGFFIDQRLNREILGQLSADKVVLNTFSYSGGFSAYALGNGATLVHSVDSSKEAIALCNQNVALQKGTGQHEGIVSDVFDYLKTVEDDFYDIIVLDPPAFAKNAKSVINAARRYQSMNLAGIVKVKPGGYVFTFSCSQHIDKELFRKIVFAAAAESRRDVRIIKQLSQPEDHPINIYHPEGEYLKGLLLKVD